MDYPRPYTVYDENKKLGRPMTTPDWYWDENFERKERKEKKVDDVTNMEAYFEKTRFDSDFIAGYYEDF